VEVDDQGRKQAQDNLGTKRPVTLRQGQFASNQLESCAMCAGYTIMERRFVAWRLDAPLSCRQIGVYPRHLRNLDRPPGPLLDHGSHRTPSRRRGDCTTLPQSHSSSLLSQQSSFVEVIAELEADSSCEDAGAPVDPASSSQLATGCHRQHGPTHATFMVSAQRHHRLQLDNRMQSTKYLCFVRSVSR
jgi:hypothetical protein